MLVTSPVHHTCAGVLTVTMATRDLVPGTHVGHVCALVVMAVGINMATPVGWTPALIASSVTAALDMQVTS